MKIKRVLISFLLLFCFSTSGWASLSPQNQVRQMVDSVIKVLQQEGMTTAEKKNRISKSVGEHLDIDSMARRILGRYWSETTEDQRRRFNGLFIRILESTYMNGIDDYSGGTVVYLNERIKNNKAIVYTKFVSDSQDVQVRYKMIRTAEHWRVFDVDVEGVSLIRNYNSSYGEIIRRSGYDGLFDLMERKVKG